MWNTPKGAAPTPKAEERISDRVCEAIALYFRSYAVTAGREVQIFRRSLSGKIGGQPGSEVDVLVQIPAMGAESGDEIKIPVEVKLSNNPEVRTGLRGQLLDRYMRQLGTDVGVFIVAWMQAPKLARRHKPLWKTLTDARNDLEKQAAELTASSEDTGIVRVFVLDAEMRGSPRRLRSRKPAGKKAAKKKRPVKARTGTTKRRARPKSPRPTGKRQQKKRKNKRDGRGR